MKRTALDATVETGRTFLQYQTLNMNYKSMDTLYHQHVDRSNFNRNKLQQITKLWAKCVWLSTKSALYDMREMEEIRAKYQNMAQ